MHAQRPLLALLWLAQACTLVFPAEDHRGYASLDSSLRDSDVDDARLADAASLDASDASNEDSSARDATTASDAATSDASCVGDGCGPDCALYDEDEDGFYRNDAPQACLAGSEIWWQRPSDCNDNDRNLYPGSTVQGSCGGCGVSQLSNPLVLTGNELLDSTSVNGQSAIAYRTEDATLVRIGNHVVNLPAAVVELNLLALANTVHIAWTQPSGSSQETRLRSVTLTGTASTESATRVLATASHGPVAWMRAGTSEAAGLRRDSSDRAAISHTALGGAATPLAFLDYRKSKALPDFVVWDFPHANKVVWGRWQSDAFSVVTVDVGTGARDPAVFSQLDAGTAFYAFATPTSLEVGELTPTRTTNGVGLMHPATEISVAMLSATQAVVGWHDASGNFHLMPFLKTGGRFEPQTTSPLAQLRVATGRSSQALLSAVNGELRIWLNTGSLSQYTVSYCP